MDWPALFWKMYLDQSITDENADRSYLSGNLAGGNVVVSMTKLSFCYTQDLQFSPHKLPEIHITTWYGRIISKKAKIRIGYGRSVPCGMSGVTELNSLFLCLTTISNITIIYSKAVPWCSMVRIDEYCLHFSFNTLHRPHHKDTTEQSFTHYTHTTSLRHNWNLSPCYTHSCNTLHIYHITKGLSHKVRKVITNV